MSAPTRVQGGGSQPSGPQAEADRLQKGLRIGLFGAFSPMYQQVGNVTTALAWSLQSGSCVDRVVIFAQHGASLPAFLDSQRVRLVQCWRSGSGSSLVLSLIRMLFAARGLDLLIFNIYPTSFGRSRVASSVGLLLPTAVALFSRRPVVTYAHNLYETQDVVGLGYKDSAVARFASHLFDLMLAKKTRLVMPLHSQAVALNAAGVGPVHTLALPFAEAVASLLQQPDAIPSQESLGSQSSFRILLLGNWGPQKNLALGLKVADKFVTVHRDAKVTVAGVANQNFPAHAKELRLFREAREGMPYTFVGDVPDQEVISLCRAHDVLLLPYNSTGGFSGVMSVAAAAGLSIVASDLTQLRETAAALGCRCTFVRNDDPDAWHTALTELLRFRSRGSDIRGVAPAKFLDALKASSMQLVEFAKPIRPATPGRA